jgi:hypothetical protein
MLKINLNLAINEFQKDLNESVAYQRDLQQNLDETKSILNKLQEKTAKELNEVDINFEKKLDSITSSLREKSSSDDLENAKNYSIGVEQKAHQAIEHLRVDLGKISKRNERKFELIRKYLGMLEVNSCLN